MFNAGEALDNLEKDRKAYVEKILKVVNGWMEVGNSDLASNTIQEGAKYLAMLDGAIQYVQQLENFEEYNYPRFNTYFN